MDIGSGIALASVAITGGGVAITAIRSFKNGKPRDLCHEHSGVCEKVTAFEAWLTKVESKLDRVIEGRKP